MLAIILFTINGCSKDDPDPPIESSESTVFNIKDQFGSGWNYLSVAKDGGYLIVKENENNGLPKEVIFRPTEGHEGYSLKFDNNGFPMTTVIEGFIFEFCNFSGTKFDMAVIIPDRYANLYPGIPKYHIQRDIDAGINLPEMFANLRTDGTNRIDGTDWNWRRTLKWVKAGTGVVACGASIAGAAASGGLLIPVAAVGCGALAVGTVADVYDEPILGISPETYGGVATMVGCGFTADFTCALGLVDTGIDIAEWANGYINNEPLRPDVRKELCNN